ncbi:homoprotocatechuate degradation operon regulator HpaR [Celeribacter sp.]|uniref:homoprotocatechuate degradation operon regulator HpaR n=1 Tax=Celeribacter sp. TaxID=1890673 RepID=UPI003A8FC699
MLTLLQSIVVFLSCSVSSKQSQKTGYSSMNKSTQDVLEHSADGLASTRNTLPMVLLRAREALMERLRPVLHAHEITEQQWRVIRILREEGCTDATSLAEMGCILPPSLTRMLKNLESRNLVMMEKDASDGRRRLVSLTPEGFDLIEKISPQINVINLEIEEMLGRSMMSGLLTELNGLLKKFD